MKSIIHFFTIILYQPLYNLLIFLAWLVPGHSIGWAIVILTIIIRLILLPQSLKAAHLQVKNLALQPHVNKIRSEIKDQAEQSKALMELYKKEGVSPLGSCLPLLIQLPILIILYQVFRNGLTTKGYVSLYSFVPHLASVNTHFLGLNLNSAGGWVLAIIAGLTQVYLSFLIMPKNQPKSDDPMAMMNKQMLYLPALMTVFIGYKLPAALIMYWIITTVFSILQQLYVNKNIKKSASTKEAEKQSSREAENIPITQKSLTSPTPQTPPKKQDLMTNIMDGRLNKQAKKAGVSVTVRTKK